MYVGIVFVLLASCLTSSRSVVAESNRASDDAAPSAAQCAYYKNIARFDSCACGAVADDMAIRSHLAETSHVILIDGSATIDEKKGLEVKRAENAMNYLVYEKGIDPSRVVLRWTRVERRSIGKWGGSLRITLVKAGDELPTFVEPDLSWQVGRP